MLESNKKIESILFVCLGNICRSPLCEAVAKELSKNHNLNLKIDSAGTSSFHNGEPPCLDSQKVAKNYNLNISNYKSTQVKRKDFKNYDLIIGLDSSNIENLKNLGCKNPIILGDFGYDGQDVPDPYYYDDFDGFEKVFNMIETATNNMFKELKLI
jgi:protein-tyrosine phosphatase